MEAVAITHLDAPGLTAQIGEALDDPNPDVVTDALLAIQGAGTEAVSSYRQKIMGLANGAANSEVSERARSVLGLAASHE